MNQKNINKILNVPENIDEEEPLVEHLCECYFFIADSSDSPDSLKVAMFIDNVSYISKDSGGWERIFYEKKDISFDFIESLVVMRNRHILRLVQKHIFEKTGIYTYIDEV